MVWASLFKEHLDVARGQPCLMLVVAYSHCGALHVGAACLLIDAIIINHAHSLLMVLLAPLLAALGILLGILDGDAPLPLLRARRSWATLLLMACWVLMLCRSSVVFLKVSVDA
jgi:hypothetical protein